MTDQSQQPNRTLTVSQFLRNVEETYKEAEEMYEDAKEKHLKACLTQEWMSQMMKDMGQHRETAKQALADARQLFGQVPPVGEAGQMAEVSHASSSS